ncbi:MAG: GAF domain-containing sensor histidine kinase, partial [Candidatus Omnitrophica bacterium]|nr:GAF domain-containing sensor histidine kinase [Candidatus Omnitrophota bacterium]
KTNSFLCAPIATDMRLIGVMSITENKSKKPYSEQDLRILEIIAGHIALKIEKSHLLSRIDILKKEAEKNGKFTDLGKIAGGISHELNSPLDGVIRYVNLGLNSIEEGVAREYLLEAKGGLLRIANIIRSLLQLVRQKKSSSYKWIDVNKTIEKSIDLMRYQAMYKGVDIKKDFCMNLPKIPDLGIDSILSNIFKNALDSLEAEGSINIATSLENNFVNISISDTGCGISKEHMEHIFEPFFTTKGTTKGTGLGLSICYDIVKRYNGKIDVVSDHGNGTKFIISLPVKNKKLEN